MLRKDISKFTYSPNDLRRNIKSEDFWKFDLKPDDIEKITTDLSDIFFNNNEKVDKLNIHNIRDNRIFTNSSLYNALTIRRTNEILKNTFFFQSYSRDQEVKQLRDIIDSEKQDSYIFRTDIKSFFEKLPFKRIIDDLFRDNLVTKTTYNHLLNIYLETSKDGFEGLPRGLQISSSLSEFALRDFNYKTRNIDECFYYSGYVDDIVLVTTKQIKNINEKIKNNLPYEPLAKVIKSDIF